MFDRKAREEGRKGGRREEEKEREGGKGPWHDLSGSRVMRAASAGEEGRAAAEGESRGGGLACRSLVHSTSRIITIIVIIIWMPEQL